MNFNETLDSVVACYSKDVEKDLPKIQDFDKIIVEDFNGGRYIGLKEASDMATNEYFKSVTKRMLAINTIQEARKENIELDIVHVWALIYDSLKELPSNATVSSIGSQGFLSIPLFKFKNDMSKFDFIRLHIWDNSLQKYFDKKKSDMFSIHTHAFLTQSWILVGKIANERYRVVEGHKKANASLFTIEYNKTIDEINQHTSVARNTGRNVFENQISEEYYLPYSTYKIMQGDFHKSKSYGENGLSASFFSFSSQKEMPKESFVVGPKNIDHSLINRKMFIDPTELLDKLNSIINSYG
jgi:hypothetical protein